MNFPPLLCLSVAAPISSARCGEYKDDPAVIAILEALGERSSAVLPPPNSECGDETLRGYYDPEHNVLLIHNGSSENLWDYRHARK